MENYARLISPQGRKILTNFDFGARSKYYKRLKNYIP